MSRSAAMWSARAVTVLVMGAALTACGGYAYSGAAAPAASEAEASTADAPAGPETEALTTDAPAPAELPAGHPTPAAPSLPSGHPTTEAGSLEAAAPSAAEAPQAGTVLELLEGGGYTYARLSMDDGAREIWVAGPMTALELGQEVRFGSLMSMGSFSSGALERTFDDLYFVAAFDSGSPPEGATTGEALEVLEGGGYTYVRARLGDDEIWLAGPAVSVAVGDSVSWVGGMNMGAFTSRSLGRTFEDIRFVDRFWVH